MTDTNTCAQCADPATHAMQSDDHKKAEAYRRRHSFYVDPRTLFNKLHGIE